MNENRKKKGPRHRGGVSEKKMGCYLIPMQLA
jgi:hypothetical protein